MWCDVVIVDILQGAAEVTATKTQESPAMALPKDYAAALRALADGYEREQQMFEEEPKTPNAATVVACALGVFRLKT